MNSPQRHRDTEKSGQKAVGSRQLRTVTALCPLHTAYFLSLCLCASVVCLFSSSVIFTQQSKGPITASGFVDGAPVVFSDVTSKTGLDKFHHRAGTPEMKYILE